jgi:hypothetical protein
VFLEKSFLVTFIQQQEMEKEFVPYELAVKLKQLGFSSSCPIGGYQGGAIFYYENGNFYYDGRPMYSSDAHEGQIDAPLFQQAFRWFREKGFLISFSSHDANTHDFYTKWSPEKSILSDTYDTYEEAELACLVKLIEILELKQ